MRFLKFFINKEAFYNIFFVPLQWTHVKTLLLRLLSLPRT